MNSAFPTSLNPAAATAFAEKFLKKLFFLTSARVMILRTENFDWCTTWQALSGAFEIPSFHICPNNSALQEQIGTDEL